MPFYFLLDHLSVLLGFGLALVLISRREQTQPASSMAWFLAIALIPYVGVPAYLLFGGRKIRRSAGRKGKLYGDPRRSKASDANLLNDTERILVTLGLPPARTGNSVRLLGNGEKAYQALMSAIDEARASIEIMTFILGRDPVGREVVRRLEAKARAGVQIRLLLDGLGCLFTRGRFTRRLRLAGGRVGVFMRMLPIRRRWSANLRNHRKIAIFDGQRAILGGMNLGVEYMGPTPDPQRWIDADAIVEGPAAGDLRAIFSRDWEFATGEEFPVASPDTMESAGESAVQVVASGPDVDGEPLRDALLALMHSARARIWIVTPYFVPDEGILTALQLQCRLGRDVRIVMPRRSNHLLADWARGPLLRRLRHAGAKVLFHPKGMIHAKLAVIDDQAAISGSANLDMRSLYINYEGAMIAYSRDDIREAEAWIENLMEDCRGYSRERASLVREWGEDLAWLLSPLL